MENAREKGLELFREIFGNEMADGVAALSQSTAVFGAKQANWTLDFPFGTVWQGEGLERKLRSCVVLGLLIAQGQSNEIKFHTRMGLKNGLTKKELEEIFYTAIPYAGFPAANTAKDAMLEAFAEMEAEKA